MKRPICPKCGHKAKRQQTRYGARDSCCGLWSWNGAPLVDARTHHARRMAHDCFDSLWKNGRMSRSRAYQILSETLGIHPRDCHMKLMDLRTALKVPSAVIRIRRSLHVKG